MRPVDQFNRECCIDIGALKFIIVKSVGQVQWIRLRRDFAFSYVGQIALLLLHKLLPKSITEAMNVQKGKTSHNAPLQPGTYPNQQVRANTFNIQAFDGDAQQSKSGSKGFFPSNYLALLSVSCSVPSWLDLLDRWLLVVLYLCGCYFISSSCFDGV